MNGIPIGPPLAARILCLLVGVMVAAVAVMPDALASEGVTVPDFKAKNLAGKNVELSKLLERGPVLLDFWATWCKPCLRELPYIEELHQKYAAQGLTVLTVSVDQTRSLAKVKSYIKTHKYEFEVLIDPNQRLLKKMKGSTVPYLLIISPSSERLYVHARYRDGDEVELAEHVDAVMAEYGTKVETEEGEGDAAPAAEDTDAES